MNSKKIVASVVLGLWIFIMPIWLSIGILVIAGLFGIYYGVKRNCRENGLLSNLFLYVLDTTGRTFTNDYDRSSEFWVPISMIGTVISIGLVVFTFTAIPIFLFFVLMLTFQLWLDFSDYDSWEKKETE